jgi:hypothetical protein
MRTKLIMIVAAMTIAGCSDIHKEKAARDPAGISAQAEKLPADERIAFEAGAERGDVAYLAANPTVADAINEGKRVRSKEMEEAQARGNKMIAQGQENLNLHKACNLLQGSAQATCRAEVNDKMMREFKESRENR